MNENDLFLILCTNETKCNFTLNTEVRGWNSSTTQFIQQKIVSVIV